MKNKKSLSNCCRAEIKFSEFAPDFIGDNSKEMKIGTCSAICIKCNKSCNFYVPIRKTWNRKPQTQIIPNKKKQKSTKLTPKELQELHKNEDF
jgi:hypothetical protein